MNKIKFLSETQKERVINLLEKYNKIYTAIGEVDAEFLSVYYLLCSDLMWDCTSAYVDDSLINFEELLMEPLLQGEAEVIAKIAYTLYNEGGDLEFKDIIRHITRENWELVSNAMNYRKLGIKIEELN